MAYLRFNNLMGYLNTLPNHTDTFDFNDDNGQPDPKAASIYADRLRRAIIDDIRDRMAIVKQRGGRVILTVPQTGETDAACCAILNAKYDF